MIVTSEGEFELGVWQTCKLLNLWWKLDTNAGSQLQICNFLVAREVKVSQIAEYNE